MVRKYINLLFAAFTFATFTSCLGGKKEHLPASIGQPYEVVLEGDTDSIVTKMLTKDAPALPQPEPMFNIIQVKKGKAKGSYQLMRTRIIVDINKRNKGYGVSMKKDANASPQSVIRIKAHSANELRNKLDEKELCKELDYIELQHLISIIKQNSEKQREVKQMFGIDMKIPVSMNASKKDKGFFWLSNNTSTGMQNLIIFRLKGSGYSESNAWGYDKEEINKVLRQNMPGETDNMYMQLTSQSKAYSEETESDDSLHPIERGLWEMKGDAMGGPFLLKVLPMSRGRIVTPRSYHEQPCRIDARIFIIGFVYAPEMKKRNLTKQLEAVLTTIH